ncbi:Vacuolar protein sorting-associated protein 29 [Hondaea fermentalgiana]|uniref:Vacuolar protein sorting-associated protein 29 n=1 Tax=Hondaea fermentalgiana TaxID=2315210 RepID=A0A2R5G1Z3_9STRA|nr:Vacuolar protein sorting-associated protein 29 [Hondaea fermentalgiana]|eukprot:GBG25036.1 Vacuolar protein sorting-associated protein 29 [Hondaea fermentalgiana]
MLIPNKTQHVLCTGNVCTKEQYEFLRSLAPSVHVVRGDMDELPTLPEDAVVRIGDFKIGVCHGHQVVPWGDLESLACYARQLDVDILISGHTHRNSTVEHEGRFYVNPGSITGAENGFTENVSPSFICLSIKGNVATTYVYEMVEGEVKIQKVKFTK